ncbi:MAG: hypothetical protein WC124_07285 [Desulfoplanes sp.]
MVAKIRAGTGTCPYTMFQIIQASWLCDVDDSRDLFPASPLNVLFFVNDFQRPTISDNFIIGFVVGVLL